MLLTSNTRSFQIGVPSFDIGAVGTGRLLADVSSFSFASRGSFKLRIFLIEAVHSDRGAHVSSPLDPAKGAKGNKCLVNSYQSACRAERPPAQPSSALVRSSIRRHAGIAQFRKRQSFKGGLASQMRSLSIGGGFGPP